MNWGRVLALHIRDTPNLGDRVSSPADYLDFGPHCEVVDVDRYLRRGDFEPPDVLVVGGGVWRHSYRALARREGWEKVTKVAWGVGANYRRLEPMAPDTHRDRSEPYDCYGHRDWGLGGTWVPCASCLHPAFEHPPEPEHEVVYYGHHTLKPLAWGRHLGPWRTNAGDSMEEVVAFLASGEVVVTSSYHGAYWARLLGRKAAILPRSSKFFHLPRNVTLTTERLKTELFYELVKKTVQERQ